MSSYYLPQPYNVDENETACDISHGLAAMILLHPARTCLIGIFRTLLVFIVQDIDRSQGKKPSKHLGDDRRQIMEFIGDLFDEQASWSKASQEAEARVKSAPNN
jgi:hypothetical protein